MSMNKKIVTMSIVFGLLTMAIMSLFGSGPKLNSMFDESKERSSVTTYSRPAAVFETAEEQPTDITDAGMAGETKDEMALTQTTVGLQAPDVDQPVSEGIMSNSRYYPQPVAGDALDVENRLYQRTSYHEVVVDNAADYLKQLKEFILGVNGKVLSSSYNANGQLAYGYIYAKVPVDNFTNTNNQITQNVKKVINETINDLDRTGQVVQTEEDLTTLQTRKAELETKIANAANLNEKSRLESELRQLETKITQAQQRVENVAAKVEYATIQVAVANQQRYFNNQEVELTPWETMQDAWKSVIKLAVSLFSMLIWVVMYSLIWLPTILIIKFVLNTLFKGKNKESKKF